MGFENDFNGIYFHRHFMSKLVSNLRKNFSGIAGHQKPTAVIEIRMFLQNEFQPIVSVSKDH